MEVEAMRKGIGLWAPMCALVLLALLQAGCSAIPTTARATPQAPLRSITVVGSGKTSLPPDLVWVNVGVDIAAETVSDAKAQVDRRMEAVTGALKEMNVAEKDIQTAYYSIDFEREAFLPVKEEALSQQAEGVYRVSTMLKVTIRDIEQLGQVLDAAVEAGANQMYGVNFSVSDPEKWEAETREKAMADAQARAEDLARLGGVELGEVLSISEVVGAVPAGAREVAMSAYGGGGISPGELEFSTQLQVSFAIE
jgi:uncharacterized protein YggE